MTWTPKVPRIERRDAYQQEIISGFHCYTLIYTEYPIIDYTPARPLQVGQVHPL